MKNKKPWSTYLLVAVISFMIWKRQVCSWAALTGSWYAGILTLAPVARGCFLPGQAVPCLTSLTQKFFSSNSSDRDF